MKEITVASATGATSRILVGVPLEGVGNFVPKGRTVIITDDTVHRLYGDLLPPGPVIRIGAGEAIKTLATVADIFEQLIAGGADRSSFVLAVGGGIVCDVAGFVASTYLRGLRFGFAATTLLAQVDASVGGKNGVNFGGYKNMVGVFNQPEFVLCDPRVLTTLPSREIGCGLAEIIKHGAIADASLLAQLEDERQAVLNLDPVVVASLVHRSVDIKAAVVNRDEREAGERRKLNFGHTFGHAVETVTGVPHGEAVSRGMAVAADLSVQRGLLDPADCRRLLNLLRDYHLPTTIEGDRRAMIEALARDKKRSGDEIYFVLLEALGQAVVQPIALAELERVLAADL